MPSKKKLRKQIRKLERRLQEKRSALVMLDNPELFPTTIPDWLKQIRKTDVPLLNMSGTWGWENAKQETIEDR